MIGTSTSTTSTFTVRQRWRRRRVGEHVVHALVLLPRALTRLRRCATGGHQHVAESVKQECRRGRGRRGADRADIPTPRGTPFGQVVVGEVVSAAFGVVVWLVAAMMVMATVRGLFYGLVVSGPYDDAWGGPTLVGAWAVHTLVWAGLLIVGTGLVLGLSMVHLVVGEHLHGERRRWWALLAATVVVLGSAGLAVAWVHQL